MRRPLRDHLNRRRFQRTEAEARASGRMVCATVNAKGKPLYFTMPRGATDAEVDAKAFAVKNGRGITEGELLLKSASQAQTVQRGMA